MRDEFAKLFAALFEHYERHLQVIRALARKQSGLTRQEVVRLTKLETGGTLTTTLAELETSGFICRIVPFGHESREPLYRLIDELTLFHLRWVEGARSLHTGTIQLQVRFMTAATPFLLGSPPPHQTACGRYNEE